MQTGSVLRNAIVLYYVEKTKLMLLMTVCKMKLLQSLALLAALQARPAKESRVNN